MPLPPPVTSSTSCGAQRRPAAGGQPHRAQHRHPAGAVGVVADLAEARRWPRRRRRCCAPRPSPGRLPGPPASGRVTTVVATAGASRQQRLGQPGGAAPVTDHHEPGRCRQCQHRLGRGQHQRDVALVAVARQAEQRPRCRGSARRSACRSSAASGCRSLANTCQSAAAGWARRPVRRPPAPSSIPKARTQGATPSAAPAGSSVVQRALTQLVEHLGELGQRGGGEGRGRHRRGQAQLARGLVDDLADRDRAQVQLVQRVAGGADRLQRQLGPLGGQPAQHVHRTLRRTGRCRLGPGCRLGRRRGSPAAAAGPGSAGAGSAGSAAGPAAAGCRQAGPSSSTGACSQGLAKNRNCLPISSVRVNRSRCSSACRTGAPRT